MMNLLVLKERLMTIYQKVEMYVRPLLKFITSLIVFFVISNSYGYDARLRSLPVLFVLAAFCAFVPTNVMIAVAVLLTFLHFYFTSKILSIIVFFAFLILYLLFLRFTPNQGIIVVLLPICFMLKIPYVFPILMGLIATPVSIIPISCGVFVYFFITILKQAALITVSMTVEDTLQLYTYVLDGIKTNKEMFLTIAIFALVLVITYVIRTRKMDHSFDIAIATGIVLTILLFLIGDLRLDIEDKILSLVLGSIGSGIIVYCIQFFRLTLDYTAVENVQFQDDDYYYYVKAVPKMKLAAPQRNVKRIIPKKSGVETTDLRKAVRDELSDRYDSENAGLFDDNLDEYDDR